METLSGIGGQMNKTKKKQEPGRKTRKAAISKRSAGNGAVKLKETADRAVGMNRNKITASLLKGMLAGDMNSGRLLVSLAERAEHNNDSETGGIKVSVATAWAAESPWTGEMSESFAETGSGSREPEL